MLINRLTNTAMTPFQALSRELDRMFEGFADAGGSSQGYPRVSIWEDADSFHLEAEVPGLSAEDLDISCTGNRVTLRGERKEDKRENASLHRQEWTQFQFERTFELPLDVDGGRIQAELKQGILHLTLPKAPEHKAVKIKVTSAKP